MVGALSLRPDASVSLSLCRTTRSTAGAGYLEAGSNGTSSRTRQYTETPRRNRRRKQSGLGSSRENTQSRGRVFLPLASCVIRHAAPYRTIVVPYIPLFCFSSTILGTHQMPHFSHLTRNWAYLILIFNIYNSIISLVVRPSKRGGSFCLSFFAENNLPYIGCEGAILSVAYVLRKLYHMTPADLGLASVSLK